MNSSQCLKAAMFSAVSATALFATPAMAVPVPMASAESGPIGGPANVGVPVVIATQASASASFFVGANDGSSAASARTNYVTRSSAFVNGSGTGNSNAILNETITNDTGVLREYFFTFLINGGALDIFSNGLSIGEDDAANASINAEISIDGSSVWTTDVEIQLFEEAFTLADGNADDDGTLTNFSTTIDSESASATWSNSQFTISLGQLAPTEFLELEYILGTNVFANFDQSCRLFGEDDEYGYGYGLCYATNARVGDPGDIEGLGISSVIIDPPGEVSEPATLALMGIGLAGMGLARRRRFR